jgi:putative endonuclease
MKAFHVYMMTNQSRVVLYTGVTNSLMRRVWQHQSGETEGFTKMYKANRLVYYQCFDDPRNAIAREKEIKGIAHSAYFARSLASLGMTSPTM